MAAKELRETLRDRRTLVTLLLMPVLLYPLLTLAFQRFVLSQGQQGEIPFIIGVHSEEDAQLLAGLLYETGLQQLVAEGDQRDAELDRERPSYRMSYNLEGDLADGRIDLGIRKRRDTPIQLRRGEDLQVDLELLYHPEQRLSVLALEHFRKIYHAASLRMLTVRLQELGVTQRPQPVRVEEKAVQSDESTPSTLATLVPIILILMTITGAVYPAIDLTAGERERGTLEMLVAAPVPRLGLLFAKYVAVVTVALLTATINLGAMTITLVSSGMGRLIFGPAGLSWLTVVEVFGLLILFAAFFSAVLLTLTSFARSFKEAQAYLIPLMLVSLGPGLAGLLPGVQLTGSLTMVPLLNVVLLSRDLLQGQASWTSAVLVVVATTLYAVSAIGLAARIFGSHAILYETQTAWSELWLRPTVMRPAPNLSTVWLCLACLFPLLYVWRNALAQIVGENWSIQLGLSAVSSLIFFAGLPALLAWHSRVDFSSTFFGPRVRPLTWPLALICGLSLWPFAHELVVWLNELGWVTLSQNLLEAAREKIAGLRAQPLWLLLVAVAVCPAIGEEWLFRGYLFRALQVRVSPVQSILISGLVFGLFHLVAVDALALERLAPSTLLGWVLGWIRWRTGSLWPGVLVHVCHNGLLTSLLKFENEPLLQRWNVSENKHLPPLWLATAAGVLAVTLFLLHWLNRAPAVSAEEKSQPETQPAD